MIKIIGGKNKKMKIEVPSDNVRPTSSSKREAIFSILESNAIKNKSNIYTNKCFLDIFAGTGSLGLEAISRGAEFCYFYELKKNVIKILKHNCKKICEKNNFKIIEQDSSNSFFTDVKFPVSVVFIDPPYDTNPFNKILKNLLKNNLINKKTILVIESKKNTNLKLPLELKLIDKRMYGHTKISFISI